MPYEIGYLSGDSFGYRCSVLRFWKAMGVWFELARSYTSCRTYQLSNKANCVLHRSNSWRTSQRDVWKRNRAYNSNTRIDTEQDRRCQVLASRFDTLQPSSCAWYFSVLWRHCQHFRFPLLRSCQLSRCRLYSTLRSLDVGQPSAATHPWLMKEGEITPAITSDEFISRRKRLLELLPDKSVAIIASAPVKMMTDVVPYTFRQDSDYLYITGCQQPGGVAVLGHDIGLCMFMPEASFHDVTWQGQIAGVPEALETFKAEQAFSIRKLREILPGMIKGSSQLFHNTKTATSTYMDLDAFQKEFTNGKVKDLSNYTHELRWVKSPAELHLMREAASIGSQALLQTIFHSTSFPDEGMLSAKVEYECKMRGAQRMSFNPVVGGGSNASVIHYSRNDQKVNDGDLVLMDIGCELHGYVSDLTRTWPPFGRFSAAHAELYSLILETNKECTKLCKPGISIQQIHNYSVEMLLKGLRELGILKDDRKSSQIYHQLNPTSIGHYLGMDVHDCSTISNNRPLKPGVVITIEPGVYIPSFFDVPKRYAGVGIRIEDEVLITDTGYEVLTGSVPKEINHLESLLNDYHNPSMLRAASPGAPASG